MDLRVFVSLHSEHFNKTPSERFGVVENNSLYQNAELLIDKLVAHVQAGKAWAGCHFEGGKRNASNAGASNLIVLDIDGDTSLEDFWAISFVERHCLLTYTSCSHNPEGEHRFRALFRCEQHDQSGLHQAIYRQVVDSIGFVPKDAAGEKPERLWFGNTKAEVRRGGGAPLNWDLIERAKQDHQQAVAKNRLPRPETAAADQQLDNDRAAYVLRHLLRASADGDFQEYWSPILNAAAATGSELVREAFFDWHARGHQSNSQRDVEKRFDKAGTRITAGQGAGLILSFAKLEHGSNWKRLLPEQLRYGYGRGGAAEPIISVALPIEEITVRNITQTTSLLRSRSAGDTAAEGAQQAPDLVPPLRELERLAQAAQPISLMASRGPVVEVTPAAVIEPLTLKQKLRRLYQLRAHGLLEINTDLQEVLENDRACLDRELLGEILAHPGYCNQPSEVERDLLTLFRAEQGLRDNSYAAVRSMKLTGPNLKRPRWLVPGFLLAGGEHILYSKPGVGKTTLALHMARAVTGDPALERFLDSGPLNNHHNWQRNPVVFIGTDMFASAEEMTTQYLADFDLLGLEFLGQVDWWFETEDTPPWQLNLKDLTKLYQTLDGHYHNKTPVAAVFIDSMKAVCPDHLLVGQQGFKDYIKLVKMICKRFSAALIWVHHSRADGSGAQGITRITEGSDANFHLKRDDKTRQITLDIEKIRGGRGRTLYIDPFKNIPVLLPNTEAIVDDDDQENKKEQLVFEVLAEHFRQHRLINMTSSAEWIERSYVGMKIGEIEAALHTRFRDQAAGISRRSLERLIQTMRAAEKIT